MAQFSAGTSLALVERIQDEYDSLRTSNQSRPLDAGLATALVYQDEIIKVREALAAYARHIEAIWILADNLDKGWSTEGVDEIDALILRSLLAATGKIERFFKKKSKEDTHSVTFLRNDVYELLVESTPDKGKDARVSLDWSDRDLLRELLRRRIVTNSGFDKSASFEQAWRKLFVSHIGTEDTANWILDRSLMRPRYLLALLEHCKTNAVNLSHATIQPEDMLKAARTFSSDLATDVGYEIRDVMPSAEDVLYTFVGAKARLSQAEIFHHLGAKLAGEDCGRALQLLLWYSFLGIVRPDDSELYIYDVFYDRKKLEALRRPETIYGIHKAFRPFLEIASDDEAVGTS